MGIDEEGTLFRLTSCRREVLDPAIARNRGRIVKGTGDGLLAEFASVVDAVRSAMEVQTEMASRNSDEPDDRRIVFRIGINVGDIVQQDGDVFGDGVNIAARLESIADPGGICVSARVQEDAAGRVDGTFEDMGEQSLKNIARPVRAFRLRQGREAAHVKTALPALPDKPSLAVLPFQNMSGDAEQDYFADGVVEDIITALSRFRSFAVVARNSSFVYKGRAVDIRQVAKELDVRYVLEGSIRRSGDRLRITAQLIEATSGTHLWADRFDGSVGDVFEVQDHITESVATIVGPQIREAEIARSHQERPDSMAAYDLYLQSLPKLRLMTEESNKAGYALIAKAIELEPTNAVLLAQAVITVMVGIIMGWPPLTNDDKARCEELTRTALANANEDAAVLASCGNALIQVSREYNLGLATLKRAVELNPNNVEVMIHAGIGSYKCAALDDALKYLHRALRLSPADPFAFRALTGVALVQMSLGNYSEALAYAERSFAAHAGYDATYWILISANAQLGHMDEARRWLDKFRALRPGMTIARIRTGQADKDGTLMAAVLEGLRLAGLEEA